MPYVTEHTTMGLNISSQGSKMASEGLEIHAWIQGREIKEGRNMC